MHYKLTELQIAGNKPIAEAKALLELLNEQYKTKVTMRFTRADKGRAKPTQSRFSIPIHATDKGEAFLFYYVIHEFVHCLGYHGHGITFKTHERDLLSLWGIDITYARAYPKALYANGLKVYDRKKGA